MEVGRVGRVGGEGIAPGRKEYLDWEWEWEGGVDGRYLVVL
jgi:hypothetical protein